MMPNIHERLKQELYAELHECEWSVSDDCVSILFDKPCLRLNTARELAKNLHLNVAYVSEHVIELR